MAKITDVNNFKVGSNGADTWASRWFFLLKEIAVQAGWAVKGSSDGGTRDAYNGVTAALPLVEQGSGGAFDAWLTGIGAPFTVAGANPGNPEIDSWLVLENDGRELLLVPTWSNAASVDGRGRMFYARKGSGGFDGALAVAGVLPLAPVLGAANEVALFSSARGNSQGADIFVASEGGYIHYWADDSPENGVLALGFAGVDASSNNEVFFYVGPMVTDTQEPLDPDPCVLGWVTNSGPTVSTASLIIGWNYGSDAFDQGPPTEADYAFWGGQGTSDPASTRDPYDNIPAKIGAGATEIFKGVISVKALAWCAVGRTYPDIGEDDDGNVFCYFGQVGGFLFPWVDNSTSPLP